MKNNSEYIGLQNFYNFMNVFIQQFFIKQKPLAGSFPSQYSYKFLFYVFSFTGSRDEISGYLVIQSSVQTIEVRNSQRANSISIWFVFALIWFLHLHLQYYKFPVRCLKNTCLRNQAKNEAPETVFYYLINIIFLHIQLKRKHYVPFIPTLT